ncbi:MAG: histidine phosphatase family protein [Ktedonobacterales bacterium]|jgi:broad specificity phosphatase PhoE
MPDLLEPDVAASAALPSGAAQAESDPFLGLKSGATEIYFIRHGDALPEAAEVINGDYDAQGLSALGRQQARALAARMRAVALVAVYSSPIGRARETAAAVADALDLPVVVDADLREVGIGPIGPPLAADMSPDEIARLLKAQLHEIAVVALTTGRWETIPGSEPSRDLRVRVRGVVERLAGAHPGQRIAIVSHGGMINAYIAAFLGLDRDYFFPAANTSVSVVRVRDNHAMLFALNDIAHLRHPDLTGFDGNT